MSALSSIASALGISDTAEPVTMGISEFDLTASEEVDGTLQAFQYFPETINDTKAPEYARRPVPGGSHPIVQFIHGGERVISFTAMFTQAKSPEDVGFLTALLNGDFNLSLNDDTKHNNQGGIPAAIAWLRSFTYPEYLDTGAAKPPPAAVIYLPNSGIVGSGEYLDSLVGVMTECNVIYEAFHRNGAPRLAAVSLSFVEIVQTSPAWRFMGRDDPTFTSVRSAYSRTMQGLDT